MRAINFSAGPAGLPLPALEKARDELLEFEGTGMSIMEQSHRGKDYERVHFEAIDLLKELLAIPETHQVLFLQGGAHLQFAMIPMNYLPAGKSADYVLTGVWAERAFEEAKTVGTVRSAGSSQGADKRYTRVPTQAEVKFDPAATYAHTTSNNTIYGTQFHSFLDTGSVPHVCDMSSDILSRPIDVSRFSLIYAGAQKNIGPSGLLAVIIRKDFVKQGRTDIPKFLRYSTHADNDSLYNTPPTFAIYLMRNVLQWLKAEGGMPAMQRRNEQKAELLYGCLDKLNNFYRAPVEKSSRSLMNVVFRLPTEELEKQFVADALKANMVGLKGHRSVGGIRVSTYNAVSVDDMRALVSFMETFAKGKG